METGIFTNRTVVPKHITEDERYIAHFAETHRRGMSANMQPGTAYFTWVDRVRVYDKDHRKFYEGTGHPTFRFYDDSERVVEVLGLLLLVDWSKCEVGDATIGRPEWDKWSLSAVAVHGPDDSVWHFRHERGVSEIPYVEIWRRVT